MPFLNHVESETHLQSWPPQEMQILLSVLRQTLDTSISHDTVSVSQATLEIFSNCSEILLRWAAVSIGQNSFLTRDVVHCAADLVSEAAFQALETWLARRGDLKGQISIQAKGNDVQAAGLLVRALHLWVFAGRLAACPLAEVVDRVSRLFECPGSTTSLLEIFGPSVWENISKALILELAEAEAVVLTAMDVEYRLVRVCLRAVAKSPHLWVWAIWAKVLAELPEDNEELVDGVLWPADSAGWRRESATQAVLEASDVWLEEVAAGVGAVALLSGRFEDHRLWKKFLGLLNDMVGQKRRLDRDLKNMANPEEAWRTASVGTSLSLIHLGNSPFCSRSSDRESNVWAKEWGLCLKALLSLCLEETTAAGDLADFCGVNDGHEDYSQRPKVTALATILCPESLGPTENEICKAITALFKASDAQSQTEAFSFMRARTRELVLSSSGVSWELLLVLRICALLCDPGSAAINSSEQAMYVLELLQTSAALAMTGPASSRPSSLPLSSAQERLSSSLHATLFQASYSLQTVLENDVEDAWLREARDWIMTALRKRKTFSERTLGDLAILDLNTSETDSIPAEYSTASAISSLEGDREGFARKQEEQGIQQQQELCEEKREAFLTHLAFTMLIKTRRPASHKCVAELTRFLLQNVISPDFPSGNIAQNQVHACLRELISNPTFLAYRAGRMEHWDEARRRVVVAYVCATLEAYPKTVKFKDLTYCVGACIGATPTEADPAGQALVLYYTYLMQKRALALWKSRAVDEEGTSVMDPATRNLISLLFQSLLICPLTVFETILRDVAESFVLKGLIGAPEKRVAVLELLKRIVFGEVEPVRQNIIAKWYLALLRDEEDLRFRETTYRSENAKENGPEGASNLPLDGAVRFCESIQFGEEKLDEGHML